MGPVAPFLLFLQNVGIAVAGAVGGLGAAASLGIAQAIALGGAVIAGVTLVANKAMASLYEIDMPKVDTDASRQRTVRSTTEPYKTIYGETLVSGPISYIGMAGTDNEDLYHVIALAGHEVTDITDIYFDNKLIQDSQINGGSSAGGNVTGGTFGPKNSTTICVINKHLGTATQTADSMMAGTFADYTSAHQGKGIAYIAMKWKLNEDSAEVWDKYAPSDIKAIVKGKPVYDPRLDTGGYGDNPTNDLFITYNATAGSYVGQGQNPALVLADYLINEDFGMGIAPSKIDWNAVVTAANGCDVSVDVPNGTQKRFTVNGVLFGTDSHRTNINKILSAMNGHLVYSNGKYILHAGIYEAETVQNPYESLNEDDLIGAIGIKTSFERSDRFNTIKGLFVDPAQNHKSTEFPKVQLSDAVNRDNGEVLEKEVQFPMTNSSYMAQRLAHKLIQLTDQQKVITFPANLSALRITAGDRVKVSIEELSWTNKVFMCVGWTFSDEGGVNLTLREDSYTSYADPTVTPNNEYSTITATGDITDAFRGVPSPSGLNATAGLKNIELNWVNPLRPADYATIYVYASPNSSFSSAVKIGETDGTQFIHDGANPADAVSVGDQRYYWVRAIKNIGTDAASQSDLSNSDSATVGAVEWDDVANPTIGIDINNDTISINTGSATTTTGQDVATSGIEAGTTVTQGGITMNQGGSIKGGQSAYNSGTGFFLGYVDGTPTGKYKFSIGNASNEALTFDGTNLAVTGNITATSGTFTGTVNASSGAFTGDVSTDSKFIAGSGATSATMDGGDPEFKLYAGAAAPADASFKVDANGVVTATRLVVTRPDDTTAIMFDSAQDGLVGIGLAAVSQETGIVVQNPSVEITSSNPNPALILSASQTITLTLLAGTPASKKVTSYGGEYPSEITATIEYSTNNGSSWSTFGSAVQLTRTAVRSPSDSTKYGVATFTNTGAGVRSYIRGIHAIDSIGNLQFVRSVSGFAAGSYIFRVSLSQTAGSDTDMNVSTSPPFTLKFETDAAGFTVAANGTLSDAPSATATIGYVQSNYMALANGNTITVGSGEINDFQDESGNSVLIISDTKTEVRDSLEVTYTSANPTTDKIFRIKDYNSTFETFSIREDGFVNNWTGINVGGGYGSTGTTIDAAGNISTDGNVTIGGDLTVQGTTTTVDTDNLTVKDNNITLNYSTGDSSSTADNAGITIQDAVDASTDASILWKTASDSFEFSHGANIPKTYLKATDQDVESGTWTSSTTSGSWGSIKLAAGYSYTANAGAYKQYDIPAGADTCYMSFLKWSNGGYVDVHAVQADGDLVFLGRISTGQSVENSNEGNSVEHDGQAIVKIGTGLDNFSSIRITNKRGTFYFSGLAFSTQQLDSFDSGMIAAEVIHSGVLSNVTNTNWDAAYTYSQVGHLPLSGGTLTGAVSWPSGGSANANTAYTYSQVGHLPLAGGALTGDLDIKKTGDDTIVDIRGNGSYDPILNLRSDQGGIASEGFQIWYDNSVGDVHLHTTYDNDVAAIRFHTKTAADKATSNERFAILGSGMVNIVSGNLLMNGTAVIHNDRSIFPTSIEVTGSYTGGSGDFTNIVNAQLKIASAGSADFWRIPHFSTHSSISGVYNYETGKHVYWGESTDTGSYHFRGRKIIGYSGEVWDDTTQGTGIGSIHLNPNSTADNAGSAITFGASDTGSGATAQAGIYVRSDGSYGTKMYLSTTNSYNQGSKTGLSLDHDGNVAITGQINSGAIIRATADGTNNTYEGVIKTVNTGSAQWGHITLGGSATNNAINNYYMVGRGAAVSDRNLSFHVPNAANYGDTTQPKFLFASTGADTLMTITASTGDVYAKGSITSASGTSAINNFRLTDSSVMGFGTVKAGSTVGHNASVDEGIFWHTSNTYGIYRNAGDWTAPDYQQLRIEFETGIEIDGGSAYGKSGINILSDLQISGETVLNTSRVMTNITSIASGQINVTSSAGSFDAIRLGSSAQTGYSNIVWYAEGGNAQIFKGSSTYSDWGGANSLNIYNNNGEIAFHPSGDANTFTINDSFLNYTNNLSSTYFKIRSTYTANAISNLTYLWLESGSGADGYLIKNGYGTGNGLPSNELYLWNSSTNAEISFVTASDISRRFSVRPDGSVYKYVDTSLGTTFVSSSTNSGRGQGYVVGKSYVAGDYVSLIEAPFSTGTDADVRIAAKFTSSGSHIIFGTSDSYGYITHAPLELDYRNYVFAKHIVGGESSHAFTPPIDQELGYSNHSFGALGILHRNAYDSYITANAYYYKTGGSSTWRNKYASYYSSIISFLNGEMTYEVSSTAPSSSGSVINFSAAFKVTRSGQIEAESRNLIMGADAYSNSSSYLGMKTSLQSGASDYMIISGLSDGNTYVSAKDGNGVYIRGGGNLTTNQILVPDNSYITVTTSNFNVTGNVTAYSSSDIRLKNNIRPITSALDKVHKINGVHFEWKDDFVKTMSGNGKVNFRKDDVGVIAQEVKLVLDEVVSEREDGTLAVRYEKIVPLLIEAIKEQTQMIKDLQTQVEDIKNGND